MFAHNVYFRLNDSTGATRAALVQACRRYLTDHPGTVAFAAGVRAAQMDRDVNDTAFDVSLHVIFEDQASHDAYQDAPRHAEFIAEQAANWAEVRVFDSEVELGAPAGS